MRIRRRLIAIMIILVALGLVAVDVVTYSSLHSYLYGRTDDQLSVAQDQVDSAFLHDESRWGAIERGDCRQDRKSSGVRGDPEQGGETGLDPTFR